MNSKRLPKRSVVGIRVCAAPGSVCTGSLQAGTSDTHGKAIAAGVFEIIQACKNDPSTGSSFYALMLDEGTLKEYPTEDSVMNRSDLKTTVHGKHSHAGLEKVRPAQTSLHFSCPCMGHSKKSILHLHFLGPLIR